MKNKMICIVTVLAMTVALTGCGNAKTTQEGNTSVTSEPETGTSVTEAEAEESTSAAYPVTIEHAFGETVIEKQPERVVTVAFGNQDVVLALGVVPVGFSAANYGVEDESGMLPWTQKKLKELGVTEPNVFHDTDGIDYEAVSDSNPDIILAPYSGMTQEEYDLLSKIAPVVAYPKTAWTISTEEWISITAKALGLEEEGKVLISGMQDIIAEKIAEHPEFEGKKFVWVSFNETDLSSLHAYSPEDTRCQFLYKFGFTYPEGVSQYIKEGSYSLSLSAENADLLYDADFLIGYSSESAYAAAAADEVLQEIPALKNNAIISIESGTALSAALTITPLAFDYTIDEYVEKLAEGIGNIQKK
ncbi:ABC transporter substrate-binding protein [Lacrimispora sp.]|uniref:ABC transporter substrate-binding protein n=1 Tax=Lacrimispora sp. TaxID=2719234 RepID=UPI003460DC14